MTEYQDNEKTIEDLDKNTKALLFRFIIVDIARLVAFSISAMFIILYLLDTLESTEVGIIFAFNFFILALTDYPTGVLADVIGYRRVLLIAYFFHICAFILLLLSDSFILFLLYSSLAAFASSQESGTLESWFDNSYRNLTLDIDPNRQIYNSFQAKRTVLVNLFSGISFVIGGLIAHAISRKFLFFITLALITLVFFIISTTIKDEYIIKSNFTIRIYFDKFLSGFKFLLSHKGIFFFFIGSTIIWAANNSIWINFLLFPTYENYSGGKDDLTALLRALIFATGVLWQLFIVKYISKINRVKFWIFICTTLSNVIFFFLIYLYYSWFPPVNLSIYLTFGLFLLFQIPAIWESLEFILRNRLNLDLVPDNIRNGIYSLLPTLTTLIGIPGALIGGISLNIYGFVPTILVTAIFSGIGTIFTGIGLLWLPKIINAGSSSEG